MYQFVKNKLVLIHEQINMIFLMIKGEIQSYHLQSKSTI